ncbi:MAG: hypothetical protein J7598_01635 [Mitsuaria chitosanitabida]|uniref:hypothetical protein n=1 Tax=Roseateles chitosanitabidus TaxID=65048 RepID=UPI001B0C5580|nr:hypothetical protein [Roseateles chitosanitabidus]MBO9685288.1 hypothetical protein [Roseateles chitosanitabidus]
MSTNAWAAPPPAASASASAPVSVVDTRTLVTMPSGWRVGDKASFAIERTMSSLNMRWPDLQPPMKITVDAEVLSVGQDGNAVHRLHMAGPGARSMGTVTVEVDLEVSSRGEILRVINLDALIDKVFGGKREALELATRDAPAEERKKMIERLEHLMSPEVVKSNLLELPRWIYAAGLGEQYRDGTVGDVPARRMVLGTDVTIDTVRRYRVETTAKTRSAVITTLEEVPSDALPGALSAGMAAMNKRLGVDDATTASDKARAGMVRTLSELRMGLRTEGRFEVEDRQPWPRAVTERRIVSGVRDGKPMSMVIETTLARIDGATPAATPDSQR